MCRPTTISPSPLLKSCSSLGDLAGPQEWQTFLTSFNSYLQLSFPYNHRWWLWGKVWWGVRRVCWIEEKDGWSAPLFSSAATAVVRVWQDARNDELCLSHLSVSLQMKLLSGFLWLSRLFRHFLKTASMLEHASRFFWLWRYASFETVSVDPSISCFSGQKNTSIKTLSAFAGRCEAPFWAAKMVRWWASEMGIQQLSNFGKPPLLLQWHHSCLIRRDFSLGFAAVAIRDECPYLSWNAFFKFRRIFQCSNNKDGPLPAALFSSVRFFHCQVVC